MSSGQGPNAHGDDIRRRPLPAVAESIKMSSGPHIQGAADSAQLQGRLLDAAAQCFAQFGLRKTTMEDVARTGGVSRATLYRYFKNRDDLLMGVVEREARATAEIIKARLAGIEHPGEHLVEGFVEALEEIPRHPTLAMVVDPDSVGMTSRLVLNSERLASVALEIMMPVMQPAQESGLLGEYVATVDISGVHVLGDVDDAAKGMLEAFGAVHYSKKQGL